MNYPEQLYYTTGHQWISFEAQYAFMGITDFAQKELADIVVVAIPYLNKTVERARFVGSMEGAKTVLDLFMPITGIIVEINPEMLKNPGLVNSDPYHTWLMKIEPAISDYEKQLLTADEYKTLIWQLNKTKTNA
jgi:glycine cleavage system H protein